MRKLLFLLLLTPLFIASSCEDDKPLEIVGNVELIVKANYDGDLFMTQKNYEYIPGMEIKFSEFNFYIANISLLEEESSTEETELSEIDFVELSYDVTQEARAALGDTISTRTVPAGVYRGLKIGFGVPSDLNRTRPEDYGAKNVLATSTHFWSPLSSYIFSKIEGFSDNNGNGIFEADMDEGFTFHLGQDDVYTERILFPATPIVVVEGETLKLTLNVDVKKLFNMPINEYDANSDDLLDLESFDQSHGNTASPEFAIDRQLMRNYSEAASLDQ